MENELGRSTRSSAAVADDLFSLLIRTFLEEVGKRAPRGAPWDWNQLVSSRDGRGGGGRRMWRSILCASCGVNRELFFFYRRDKMVANAGKSTTGW